MDAINGVYGRFQSIVNEIDVKADSLKAWQITALHQLAEQAEGVLNGTRRKTDRRGE